jgi:hypothetical protein
MFRGEFRAWVVPSERGLVGFRTVRDILSTLSVARLSPRLAPMARLEKAQTREER